MVAPEQRVPIYRVLPIVDDLLKTHQIKGNRIPLAALAIHIHNVSRSSSRPSPTTVLAFSVVTKLVSPTHMQLRQAKHCSRISRR